ncbi:LTA synthase family protein [Pontibacter qinzhouensis]|uniref:LTA synthase family protein n=1 Tax=Pontibacter qinzhouensis TaxID=2603253 RepID=A0A5C8KDW4_9BACT|nr:LTA synthase family protein [Pontibacter qinzhouensis]TXK52411.1 LTA synthase family protein [Pontibacter qinzhouensis]
MKRRIFYQPLYFLFWIIYFFATRAIFLLYHLPRTKTLTGTELFTLFKKGLPLDVSFAAYCCLLPFLAITISMAIPRVKVGGFIRYYTYGLILLLTVLLAGDLELYNFWGFRLDASPLQYLNTPAELLASTAIAPWFLLTSITALTSALAILLYRFVFDYRQFRHYYSKLLFSSIAFLYLIFLVVPMRGGFQQIPINQSIAYFSDKPFANHASLNMPWNLMHSLLKYNKEKENPYQYMQLQQAEAMVNALYTATPAAAAPVLVSPTPNVLFIVLESFTGKLVGSIGGEAGVTPILDQLAAEGINFTNMYASGDRSEKGLVSILSGYPVQTTTSIIKNPRKSEKLPELSQVFEQQGYSTSFYYGGELEFANIKSYLLNGGYDRLISKSEFDPETYNSKWGAHDHVLFERVLTDLKSEKQPFFSTVFTLSSHEPYDIPIPAKFPGNDFAAKFRNSVYYTDWALGKFIEAARQEAWWQNTLIVLVADHGHPLPNEDQNHVPLKFRIPFIMTGGALQVKGEEVHTIGSQTDIAATLLHQLRLPASQFNWSRNLLAPGTNPFAFYVYNDGFGFVTEKGVVVVDNIGQNILLRGEGVPDEQVELGKAYMQASFEDFIRK